MARILVGEKRPNLNDIRNKTLDLKVPTPKIKRDVEALKVLNRLVFNPFTI